MKNVVVFFSAYQVRRVSVRFVVHFVEMSVLFSYGFVDGVLYVTLFVCFEAGCGD